MQQTTKKFDKLIKFFVLFMPIIDILTSIMTYNGITLSLGLMIKTILLAIISIYMLFSKNTNKISKIFTIVFYAFIGMVLLNNAQTIIETRNLDHLKFIIKFAYFIIISIFFITYLKNEKIKIEDLKIPIKIILLSILIATITGTAMPSYTNPAKVGIEGWFYSANELGSLLTLLYPVSLYLFFHHEKSKKIEYIYIIVHAIALLLLGTKVGLIAFLIITTIYLIYRIITIKRKCSKFSLVIVILLLLSSGLLWEKLPAVINSQEKYETITNVPEEIIITEEMREENINEMIYSGRHNFYEELKKVKTEQDEKSETSKSLNDLFGFMYLTNGNFLLVERDFHDAFLFLGMLGLLFTIVVLVLPFILSFKEILKNLLDTKIVMLTLGLGITCGCAFISGHTLYSPMVAFYIAIILGFIANYKKEKKESRKEILISTVHMDFGGIETTLINLLNNIDYKKFNIDLCLLLDGPLKSRINENVNHIKLHDFILHKIVNKQNIICKIIKHLLYNKYTAYLWTTNKNYDAAIDYSGYYNFITYYVASSLSDKKLIWVHAQPSFILMTKELKKYKKFNKVIFVSNVNKEEMVKKFPQYKEKYDVMWNLLTKPNKDDEEINWKKNTKRILAVGRLCEQKRYDKMLLVAKELKKKKCDFELKILGDGPLKKELIEEVEKLGLKNNVKFLGSKSNVGNYLETADIYIMTSDYEGLPTVILESLTYGLSIVGYSIPPLEEIQQKIAPEKTITLVNNAENFAKKIIECKNKKNKMLDIKKYNESNLKKFESLIK